MTSAKRTLVFKSMLFVLAMSLPRVWAQVEVDDAEMEEIGRQLESQEVQEVQTGEEAAREYFNERQSAQPSRSRSFRRPAASTDRYLSLHVGTFINEETYRWGDDQDDDVGQLNAGVTYRIGEWVNSMDLLFRADYTNYSLREGSASKLSLLPIIAFPDANSGFPLYFGAGAGLGIFMKQIDDESALSFDYQVLAGARFFDVIESFGFMIEAGMKNHLLLFSDGQYNGVFVTVGGVFNF